MRDNNNLPWLLIAALAVGVTLWSQETSSSYQATIERLQNSLNTCKAEFATFKDGVTYGK
ncbi:hypothetical protein [Anabaena sp. CCY 9402-a]|uniref:hypothetical protein n=1 Tax=Anabaena sp. CCY 9402-a TaxID=3103867 RepID=UPI0039C6DB17